MPEIHQARRARASAMIAGLGADAALITRGPNVRYLTGLASSNAALLLSAAGDGVLATDSRYAGAAQRDAPDLELAIERNAELALAARAVSRGAGRLAFEAHEMTVERYQALTEAADTLQVVPLGRKVEELRFVKDEAELELLAVACQISAQALAGTLPRIAPGITERELAGILERRMAELGAEAPSFETIVASGPNGAIPHHAPGSRPLARGDLVTIDFGARHAGYHADMTRTVAVGTPAGWQRDVYDLVARAQQAGIEALAVGAEVADVDGAAREVIAAAGHGEHFGHGLGHGVGLEIHEAPIMGYGRAGRLSERVPVTVEPGVYLPGKGGVRIEDVLVVTAGAGARALTLAAHDGVTVPAANRELLVL